ncbi:hypothetical protein K9F62_00635 [Desulfovibrio sp. JY]|nr:hypothetical protein K9F62_00635 [Desulfovibrio sp. JY]
MTEIEHLLTDTLTVLERELRQAQGEQAKTISRQEQELISHTQALHQIQNQTSNLRAKQRELTKQLQRLSELYTELEPLLIHLNVMLGEK